MSIVYFIELLKIIKTSMNIVLALPAMSEREKAEVTKQVLRALGPAPVEKLIRYLSTKAHRKPFSVFCQTVYIKTKAHE
ncbi:hypothetical protein GCK32_013000 [Trichostrongylus colubriformis]|uniref:Uncharacterized protein n=1 Tax=Trichostrongylus colubriformis TaxID=6319 RepID=A0AAN8IPE4_TRICO